jgi:hypothetical protein
VLLPLKYSPEFLETNARLKTLDEETLNDELNKMTTDELLAHGDYMIQQTLEEKDLLSEEEAQAHINELLQLTREPSEDERKPIKVHTHRTAKRILILAAAILILISVFMVAAVASKRDFSILNGVVRFENGKIHVHFSDPDDSASMTMAELEADLQAHGFDDVKLPRYFYEGEWQIKDIAYEEDENLFQAIINVTNANELYSIRIVLNHKINFSRDTTFFGAEGGETIQNGMVPIYVFDHGEGRCELIYFIDKLKYEIKTVLAVEKLRAIAETVV